MSTQITHPDQSVPSAAEGDAVSPLAGYKPTGPRAVKVWNEHREEIECWFTAIRTLNATDARRVASAVLEFLEWSLVRTGSIATSMTEEELHAYRVANPNGLGVGSLSNVRARVRRAIAGMHAVEGESMADTSDAMLGQRAEESRLAAVDVKPYSEADWSVIAATATADPELAVVVAGAWERPETHLWDRWKELVGASNIDLRQSRVQVTINTRALAACSEHRSASLAQTLQVGAIGAKAAAAAARALPAVQGDARRDWLRTPAGVKDHCHCEGENDGHGAVVSELAPVSRVVPVQEAMMEPPAPKRRKVSARQARLAVPGQDVGYGEPG